MPCAHIALTELRQTELREFLRNLLPRVHGLPLEQVYVAVADHFGDVTCEPETHCPHYEASHPEFHHLVRRALQDGKDADEFDNGPRGLWRRV